jgi:hypothetical protein
LEVGDQIWVFEPGLFEGGDECSGDALLFVGEKSGVLGPVFGSGFLNDKQTTVIDPGTDERGFADYGAIGVCEEPRFGGVDCEQRTGGVPV